MRIQRFYVKPWMAHNMDDSDKIKLYIVKIDQLEQDNMVKDQKIIQLEKLNAELLIKLVENGVITEQEKTDITTKSLI